MTDTEFKAWNRTCRERAVAYLRAQGVEAPNVADWPAFEAAPHFGVWCVESQKVPGKIGWWVFAGDCPTDYVSEDGRCHPRAALENLLGRWKTNIPYMKRGEQPPGVKFDEGANLIEMGNLLEKRIGILEDWTQNDSLWKNQ